MRNVSISLTDQHAAAIESEIASGDYASVSEVVRAALREFLARAPGPDVDIVQRDIAAYLASRDEGRALVDAKTARARLRAAVAGRGSAAG